MPSGLRRRNKECIHAQGLQRQLFQLRPAMSGRCRPWAMTEWERRVGHVAGRLPVLRSFVPGAPERPCHAVHQQNALSATVNGENDGHVARRKILLMQMNGEDQPIERLRASGGGIHC